MSHYHYRSDECDCVSLCINKIDGISGAGISGAVFQLTSGNGFTCLGTTGPGGILVFRILPCSSYLLKEDIPPAGYAPADHVYNICVDACGCIFVDDVLTSRLVIRNTPTLASFTAVKVNIENEEPLAGAGYTLFMNSAVIASTVSNAAGQITFTGLSPGTYALVETTPPPEFQTNPESLTVTVAQDGNVTINGEPADGFIIHDIPLSEFIFRKLDALTRLPLAGAAFSLAQNGAVIGTAVSGGDGLVNFGILATGIYQLTETIAPPGYRPNNTVYQVVVTADGAITVSGVALEEFAAENNPVEISASPIINTIIAGAQVITGFGVAGASITVTLPNGSTVSTAVSSNSTWLVNVPAGTVLAEGDVVSAVQTETGKEVSGAVHEIVIGSTDIEPGIDIFVENLTTGQNFAVAGDTLLYDVILANNGTASSVWQSAYAVFFLSTSVTLQVNSIRINNRMAAPGQFSFDSAANTLTVFPGDIAGGGSVSISYRVTVNSDIPDINEIILDVTLGSLG